MGIADATDLHVLLGASRCGDGGIRQRLGAPQRRRVGAGNKDRPARLPGRRITHDDVAACFHHRRADATRAQDIERFLQDVALGDAAQVEPHAVCPEPYQPAQRVHFQQRRARARSSARELIRVGQPAGTPRLAPELHEGTNGDVERAAAVPRDFLGTGQDCEQLRAHGLPVAGVIGKHAHLAARAVIAHFFIQLRDPRECRARSVTRNVFRRGMQHHSDRHTHVNRGEFAAHLRIDGGGQEKR